MHELKGRRQAFFLLTGLKRATHTKYTSFRSEIYNLQHKWECFNCYNLTVTESTDLIDMTSITLISDFLWEDV